MTVTILQSVMTKVDEISVTKYVTSRYAEISVFFDYIDRRITLVTLFYDSIYKPLSLCIELPEP